MLSGIKSTFVNVFLILEVNLLAKVFFLFLTTLLVASLLSQSSADVTSLFTDK